MSEPQYAAVRLEKCELYSKRCQTGAHRRGRQPWATVILHKPVNMPDLPGPQRNYLCDDCIAVFLERTAIQLPWTDNNS